MATRASEAATLNATLETLKNDVAAYLAAGAGDHHTARSAVFSAMVTRLAPVMGRIQHLTPTSGEPRRTGAVPDQVHPDLQA